MKTKTNDTLSENKFKKTKHQDHLVLRKESFSERMKKLRRKTKNNTDEEIFSILDHDTAYKNFLED